MLFAEKKELAVEIITLFSDRMKWGVFSRSIKNNSFPAAANYIKLIEKIEELAPSEISSRVLDTICELTGYLKEHALSGEKAVRFAKVSTSQRQAFDDFILDTCNRLGSQNDRWLFEREPSIGAEETPELVHSVVLDNGLAWVFNSTRETTNKVEIPATAISDEYRHNHSENEQFFVIKKIVRRCHDVIFYNQETGVLEFRIDNPLEFSSSERGRAFHMLEAAFNALCMHQLGRQIKFEVVELFETILAIYSIPPGDGRVVELSFTTDEGGIKNSKKRFKDGCILEEEFHKSGCLGINNQLTPYKIARVWPFRSSGFNSDPELMLPGSLRMVSLSGGDRLILDEFLVTKSVGHNDYKMIVDKLCTILNIEQGNDGQSRAA